MHFRWLLVLAQLAALCLKLTNALLLLRQWLAGTPQTRCLCIDLLGSAPY